MITPESVHRRIEIIEGEGLKTAAEVALSGLSRTAFGEKLIELYAFGFGGRIADPSLHTTVAGIDFENPVLFGAGWDKKGRAVRGLHALGFAGGEVGTVLPYPQYGNEKPRLWTINEAHSVGLNRLGFNSLGMEAVAGYLEGLGELDFPIGINVGKNKIAPNEHAPWSSATVIKRLYPFASYFSLGVSSPNTPGLRSLQGKEPLRENIQASMEAMEESGGRKPLLIKIDGERSDGELHDLMEVSLEEGAAGIIAINTYSGSDLKAKYGERWAHEAGGLSGADPDYRKLANQVVKRLYEEAGADLAIVGVGGVSDTDTALDMIQNGASAVQVVTAIRPSWGRVAARISRGLVESLDKQGIKNIKELIGTNTHRGGLQS